MRFGRGPALALVALILTSGCVSLQVATVPRGLLDTHGWRPDPGNTTGPESQGAFAKVAQRTYRDDASAEGYPAMLVVTSFRALVAPDSDELVERAREQLQGQAEAQGYDLEGQSSSGERTVAGDRPSQFFVFSARALPGSDVFERDSTIKVLGEVFRCPSGTVVIVAATAQVNSVRYIGGVPVSQDPDDANWVEIVQDPSGTIEGQRGQRGLVHGIVC